MKRTALVLVALEFITISPSRVTPAESGRVSLPQALLTVAQTFHVSVLGEVSDPVPKNISLPRSKNAAAAIDEIASQCPGYISFQRQGVYLVVQKDLLGASGNPMNQRLTTFDVPSDLSRFKLEFPSAVAKAQQHITGRGAAVEGFPLPTALSPPLKEEELRNLTARQVLIKVAREVGNLYSVLVLPTTHPTAKNLDNRMFVAWDIAGGPGLSDYTTHLIAYPYAPESR